MANVDGTLRFDTKLDTKGIDTGLKSIDDKLKGIQKSATVGLGAIATGLVAAGTAGVKFNAEMEQYTATFETFTGSADKAAETMDRLLELGAETPFETTDLANATQLLMAYGFSADEAVDSLTMLGDASQGNVEKLNSIATGFARMRSSGKVTLEYLNLMIENGFNPLNQVAEDAGMTMAEVYDAISAGEITFEQVESAMVKMTSEGGQYFGLMEKQSQTLNGRLSTLSDTVQMKLGEAFESVTNKINEMLPTVIDIIDNLDVNQIAKALIGISGTLGVILGITTALRGAIALANFATVNGQVVSLGTAISSKLIAPMKSLIVVFGGISAPVLAVVAGLAALGVAIYQLWQTNEDFRKAVIQAWNNIKELFINVYNTILKPIFENLAKVIMNVYENGIKPLWDSFVSFVGIVVTKASELLDALMPFFNWMIQTFGPMIVGIINFVANAFGEQFNFILGVASIFLDTISGIISNVIDVFIGIIDFITGVFTGDWKKAWEGIKQIFSSLWNSLAEIVDGVWKTILSLFARGGEIFSGVVGAISNVFKDIVNVIIDGLNKVIRFPFDRINDILNMIKNLDIPLIGKVFYGFWDWNPLPVPQIPKLEKGGILNKGQMGFLEGNGAEAVVPLEKNRYWVKAVAKEFARIMPNMKGGQTINFYSTVATPDEVSRKLRIDERLGLIG